MIRSDFTTFFVAIIKLTCLLWNIFRQKLEVNASFWQNSYKSWSHDCGGPENGCKCGLVAECPRHYHVTMEL